MMPMPGGAERRSDPRGDDDAATEDDSEAIAAAAAAAAAVVDILSSREGVEAIPLAPHRCAATAEGRREGLVVDDDDDDDDGSLWTARDTDRVLELGGGGGGDDGDGDGGRPLRYEVYLGLRFYEEDPLPAVRRAWAESGRGAFVDHEFPVFPGASVLVGGGRLLPGILLPSNRDDFESCGDRKRAGRVRHFASRAGAGGDGGGWEWKRASSMADDAGGMYEIFLSSPDGGGVGSSIDPRNVVQGRVGNCGFCSGLASVAAARPEIVVDAFGPYSEECLRVCGAYSVRLFPRGRRRFLLLDDYLLCAGGGSNASPSLHSSHERDLWIRLLEKAFVKVQGSYASLDGYYKLNSLYRHPARALQLLTGAPAALEVCLGGCDGDDDDDVVDGAGDRDIVPADEDEAYGTLADTQGVCARVAHCRRTVDGLRSNHGYSLLWIGSVGRSRLVCLRNPHGRGSYTGPDWGVGSPPWRGGGGDAAARRMLEENACFVGCDSTGRITWRGGGDSNEDPIVARDDDGIFFMGFATFLRFFPIVTLVGPLTSCPDVHHSGTDVPDCVHSVKGNIACVKEILGVIRTGLR